MFNRESRECRRKRTPEPSATVFTPKDTRNMKGGALTDAQHLL